jgi:glycosyl transferase family 4
LIPAPPSSLAVLLTNYRLKNRGGTQLVIRDLALALQRAGHRPMVYSPILGEVADEIAAAGILVSDRIDGIPAAPDIIHGQHHVETVEAMLRFPEAPAIYGCNDRIAIADVPPQMPGIRAYAVPDENCRERVALLLRLPPDRIRVIPNWVDTARFAERSPLPDRPRRALIFSNYAAAGGYMEAVEQACRARGVALDTVGHGVGRHSASPEELLPNYDIVFGKARCALEAAAVGCAVVLCDRAGLGPMVRSADLDRLRAWNFGMRLLTDPITPEALSARIAAYDAEDARSVSRRLRTEATLDHALASYLALYRDAIASARGVPPLSSPVRLRRYLEASIAATAHLEHQVGTDDVPVVMRRLTATERRAVTLKADRGLQVFRTGLGRPVAVTVRNPTDIALRLVPPYPFHVAARWEPADRRRGETGVAWEGPMPVVVPANGEAGFQIEVQPPRSGRLRLKVQLLQQDPLAPGRPTVIAETVMTTVVLPANLPRSIVHLWRRAARLAWAWRMFI